MPEINKVIEIVKNANDIVMEVYNRYLQEEGICINYKDDNSPLTEADLKASNYICSELNKLYPDIPIICEETKKMEYSERKDWTMFWLVDPVDGTKEFVKKNGEFTVNIGLIENNKPIMGVVGVPVQNVIYYGDQSGAFKLNLNVTNSTNNLQSLTCKSFTKEDPIVVASSRSHANEETQKYLESFNVKSQHPSGSSLKFMLLAENKAQLYPRLALTSEWDIAASHAILVAAGGSIYQVDGQEINYNKESFLNPYFIASTNPTFDNLK
jgi:3'(2'), 5'-bisphosphate nucleotidase